MSLDPSGASLVPTWNAFADYLATELPHLRADVEEEALEWSPSPHYFLEVYFLPEFVNAVRAGNDAAAAHASAVLEAVLGSPDQDLWEAALHSVVEHVADSPEYDLLRSCLGPLATSLVIMLRALPGA